MDDQFLWDIHGVLDLSLKNNIVLKQWTKTVTTLLEKKIGNPFIYKFWAIHTVEGDLQSHKMIKYAEGQGLITNEQYGGRKNKMAQSVVLNKLCYYNICHQTLTSCAFMDDDARACYDWILTRLSSLECQKWGLSKNVTDFTNNVIENQNYHVRSAYGISKDFYAFRSDSPTQGSGQGVSWAGARWCQNVTRRKNAPDFSIGQEENRI